MNLVRFPDLSAAKQQFYLLFDGKQSFMCSGQLQGCRVDVSGLRDVQIDVLVFGVVQVLLQLAA